MALGTVLAELAAMHVFLCMTAETGFRQAGVTDVLLHMAGIAGCLGMLAGERETGLLAVIETHAVPAIGGVTRGASWREAAEMHIIRSVTAGAAKFRILVRSRDVARLTGDHGVKAAQRKPREAMIEHDIGGPRGGVVAFAALRSELCLVNILGLVAAEAAGLDLRQNRITMTTGAGSRGMRPFERKPALCVMIKGCRLERRFRVAGLTISAKPRLMHVLNGVAIIASCGHALVDFTEMA